MTEKLLQNLLHQEITPEELKLWLSGKADKFNAECSPQEFITYFITYLRDGSSRYVQSSAVSTLHNEQASRVLRTSVTKRNKINTSRTSLSVSHDGNVSVYTSTPKRRPVKSFTGSDSSFNDSQDHSFKHNRSMDHKSFPTLESYLTESLFSHSKENLSNNRSKKKKKCPRNSCSPGTQDNDTDKCKHEITRRIKPTEVSNTQKPAIIGSNSFSFAQSNCEIVESGWQRNILREERQKIAARSSDQLISVAKHAVGKQAVHASVECIVDRKKLDLLAAIYSAILDLGLVLSFCSELHFVLTLLLAGSQRECDSYENSVLPLASVHDCVYLAARVLETQTETLRLLNRATIKLLCENSRVEAFCPKLSVKLREELIREQIAPILVLPVEHATFVPDTDSRDNFPDGQSFVAFCKQRDGFCELIRLWEEGHARPGWNYATALGPRTRIVLLAHLDPANHLHLARLFKQRLLGCTGRIIEPLALHVSSDKLQKLNTRLENGDSQEEFPQRQEFYREFATSAFGCCPSFIKHLEDCLAHKLLCLEEEFGSRLNDADSTIDSSSVNADYVTFLKSTRLLAKFLGYLQALPYKSDVIPTGAVLKSLLATRSHTVPIIDLEKALVTSIRIGCILGTLPWTVEFLRQLDSVSFQLPAYERVINRLFHIYFAEPIRIAEKTLIRLALGRLFEAVNFPRQLFYAAMADHLENGSCEALPMSCDFFEKFISEQVLYECAPALFGLRTLLATGCAPVCIRYIRPVTALGADVHNKREQKQLEDVFFHGHPESMRRSVDFAAERISSAIVNLIKRSRVPATVDSAIEQLWLYINTNRTEDEQKREDFLRSAVQRAKDIAEKELTSLKVSCIEDARRLAKNRSELSIPALLSYDVHPATAAACVAMTARKATDRVLHWIEQTLNIAQIMDPLTKELGKIEEESKTKQNNRIAHYLTLQECSAVKVLIDNKKLMFMAHENPELLTCDGVQSALQYTAETVRRRKDINPSLKDAISAQIVDLALALIVQKPELAVENVEHFVSCLEVFLPSNGSREGKRTKEKSPNVLNVRNVYLVYEGPDSEESWKAYKCFLTALLKRRVLSAAAFESQVLKLFQKTLPEVMFAELVVNVKQVIDEYGVAPEMIRAAACLTSFLVQDLP